MRTEFLEDNILLLLVLGMIAVGAHAYTLFKQRIDGNEASARWRFLSTIPIQLVTKKSNFNLGFLAYLFLFELLYLILASSGSLVLMLYQLAGREEMTGALSESIKPSGAVPILASTAIILLTQVKPFSSFEILLRSVTHRVAEIPDGLKTVKQKVARSLHNEPLVYPDPGSNINQSFEFEVDKQKYALREQERERRVNLEEWIFSELGTSDGRDFIKSYWNMLWLNEYTLETVGEQTWDAEESEEIIHLFQSTEHEVAQFRSAIESAAKINPHKLNTDAEKYSIEDEMDNDEQQGYFNEESLDQAIPLRWKNDKKKCAELEERLTLLFTLLIINQPDVQTDNEQLRRLIDAAHDRQHSKIANCTAASSLIGGVIILFLFTGYYWAESSLKSKIRQDPYLGKAPFGDYVQQQVAEAADDAYIYRWSGLVQSERINKANDSTKLFSNLSVNLNEAFAEALLILLIFIPSVAVALSSRRHRITLREWELPAKSNKTIFMVSKYYLTCTLATLCTMVIVFMFYFVQLWLLPSLANNKDLLSIEAIEEFDSFASSIPLTALIAWFSAYYSLYLADTILMNRTYSYSWTQSVLTSIFFASLCALVAFIGDLYVDNLHSNWYTSSKLFINFLGFTVLFITFSRFYLYYSESERSVDENTNGIIQPPPAHETAYGPTSNNKSNTVTDKSEIEKMDSHFETDSGSELKEAIT